MQRYLIWNKGFFDSNYQLFGEGKIQASLLFNSWKNEARGIGLNSSYFFRTIGFVNPSTDIIDGNNEIIGTIKYDSWHSKATLTMRSGEVYAWAFTNSWLSKWTISNFTDKQVIYEANSTSGKISANTDDEVMLLSGLFIKEYYSRILILIIVFIVIIPILSRGF